jgi:hypothetical protein
MTADRFEMRSLLERAGFTVRGATRADCIHCTGRSRGTVSFTPEVAFCHRCNWRANFVTMARESGLPQMGVAAATEFPEEMRRRTRLQNEVKHFEVWRDDRTRDISYHFHGLSRTAVRAAQMLSRIPDGEEAWNALARFYHAEAQLSAAFDWLMFTKASAWLEEDSTPIEVFDTWRAHAA